MKKYSLRLLVLFVFLSSCTLTEIGGDDSTEVACTQGSMISVPAGDDKNWSELQFYTVTSEDGVIFDNEQKFVQGAGVPSVTTGTDGTLVAVFQWFPNEEEDMDFYNKVAVKQSTDNGESWTDAELLCINDFPEELQPPFDPTITVQEDGTYRLFFTTHEGGSDAIFYYGSATSEDGINFSFDEGAGFKTNQRIVDGSEVRVGNKWYMIAPLAKENGVALDAVSDDGRVFTESESNRGDFNMHWVGNMVNANGTIRFYGTKTDDMSIGYSSTTDGETWEEPVSTNLTFGGDPGITQMEDGTFLLIYAEPE